MPYIKPEDRNKLTQWLNDCETIGMLGCGLHNTGQLNYTITCIIRGYLAQHGKKYQTMNDIVGALESAKAEFQRRVVGPYEDSKIESNGDVY